MPKGIKWVEPQGGFYMWLSLPDQVMATALFKDCLKQGLVFVTGRTFDPENVNDDHLRLSFSNMPKEDIEKGVILLSQVIRGHLKEFETLEPSKQNQ